ncbi:MAG: oligosaccharide flippase family protein [Ignavibacteria bacterium]|nr:oligosaccharide flippase family protein [Ignavibacteria bacterium]
MRVIVNFISKIGVDSVARLIGFLTLPFITRTLGPEGYGAFSYYFVIASYYGFFIDFGYLSYGTNKLIEKEKSEDVISRILSLQILTALLSYSVLLITGFMLFDRDKFLHILFFSLIFIPQIIAIRYFYLAGNRLYFNSLAELAGQAAYAITVFTVFAADPSVETLIALAVLQALVTGLVLFLPYIRKHRIRINLNLRKNIDTVKEAYKLGLSSKAEGVTSSFIILMTGTLLSESAVGYYNASYKIYLILLTLIQGLSYALMPVLLKIVKEAKSERTGKISLIFYSFLLSGVVLGSATMIFSERIILLMFGSEFMEAVPVLQWFAVTIMLWPLLMFTGLMLLAQNRHTSLLALSLVSMISSVVFSIILIRHFGLTGSAMVLPSVAVVSNIAGLFILSRSPGPESSGIAGIISPLNFIRGLKETYHRMRS